MRLTVPAVFGNFSKLCFLQDCFELFFLHKRLLEIAESVECFQADFGHFFFARRAPARSLTIRTTGRKAEEEVLATKSEGERVLAGLRPLAPRCSTP